MMSVVKTGEARVKARSRLMLLLGEQLITDEVAAMSELVKNAYDADATKVKVTLHGVSDQDESYIIIKDNGHGMSLDTVLSSWLELGTLSKARGPDRKPRFSESGNRVCLGEKGLGRLAVHKLGYQTELITRRKDTNLETKLTLDWYVFEKNQGFLQDIPVKWEVTEPRVFVKPDATSGTQITITKLHRKWSATLIEKIYRNVQALKSPFVDLSDFDIEIEIEDKLAPAIEVTDIVDIIRKATYTFIGEVSNSGQIKFNYSFNRPDLIGLDERMHRQKEHQMDIRDPEDFEGDRKPMCGPFRFRFYSWDLHIQDKKAVLGSTAIYREMIQPNTGIKVFRDGFRVLPYGNPENDWLSMDSRRVRQFEMRLSRNQVIRSVEISSKNNPGLLDKTDREGLIDNDEFRDFRSLVTSVLSAFESERHIDRRLLKTITGRTREKSDQAIFTKNLTALKKMVWDQSGLPAEVKLQIDNLISDTREAFDDLLAEKEQPLLVAASIGLTYTIPAHEILRDLHESLKILRKMRESEKLEINQLNSTISLIQSADATIRGLGRLMQKTSLKDETFKLEKPVESAITLLRHKLERSKIKYEVDIRSHIEAIGSDRLITILLLNFIDNSFYWLLRKKPGEGRIKIIVDKHDGNAILVVSDNGPGFEDDLDLLTLPFFTRKPNGMGLGLYIADRIANMNNGRLEILDEGEIPGLLSGANIGVVLPIKAGG